MQHPSDRPSRRRRAMLAAATASAALGGLPAARAQESYPRKTVRLIVNFPPGGPLDILARTLASATGAKVNHILYKGNAPAVLAVVSGEVQGGILATPGFLPQVKAGKVIAVAVTSPRRSPLAPEVPTVAEAGLPDLGFEVLYDALVPAATPQPIVDRLATALAAALAREGVRKRMASLDMDVLAEPGEAARQRLARLRNRYAKTIAATGMRAE